MASSVMAMARRSRATSSRDLMTRRRSVPGPVESAGEYFRGKGGLLPGNNAEVGGRNAEQAFELAVPRSAFRVPRLILSRNHGGASRHKVPPLHRPSSS